MYQHSITPISLPCALCIPDTGKHSQHTLMRFDGTAKYTKKQQYKCHFNTEKYQAKNMLKSNKQPKALNVFAFEYKSLEMSLLVWWTQNDLPMFPYLDDLSRSPSFSPLSFSFRSHNREPWSAACQQHEHSSGLTKTGSRWALSHPHPFLLLFLFPPLNIILSLLVNCHSICFFFFSPSHFFLITKY